MFNTLFRRIKRSTLIIVFSVLTGLSALAFVTDEYFEISKNLDIFITLFRDVNTFYVDETQPGKMIRSAIDHMLDDLDPYTNFISESEIEDYRFQVTGQYGGIGLQIVMRDQYPMVTDIYDGYPSQKAGILPGDIITEVDGLNLKGKSSGDISKLLKGQAHSKLILTIQRNNEPVFKKELIREEIHVKNVPYSGMISKTTGYIALSDFRNDAGKDVATAFRDLREKFPEMKNIILDLRGNPGGLLIEAINVVNVFVPKNQLVVSTRGKVKEWEKEYKTQNTPLDENIPLIVLTDRGSASASEIVSGTIQDIDRGLTVGQRTFGKGLVQSTRPLSYGTQLKVTTAKYYTPSGRCIQALDYTHRNEDGSVGEVPDSLKRKFKTRAGRPVYDGGGIDPDLKITDKKISNITQTLKTKLYIFDFATEYYRTHKSIAEPGIFSLTETDWLDFLSFLKSKNYSYHTQTEKSLEELKKKAMDENYFDKIKGDYEVLLKSIQNSKQSDINIYKSEIMRELELEIIKRYYYLQGYLKHQFKFDKDIQASEELFNNTTRFQTLLKP